MIFARDCVIFLFPLVICAFTLLALAVALARYFCRALSLRPRLSYTRALVGGALRPRGEARARTPRILAFLLAAFIASRACVWLIGLVGCALKGQAQFYMASQDSLWSQWDAPHYMGIAQNGYTTQGDARLHIVFYPLYPLLVRAFSYVFQNPYASAYILSNAFLLAGAFVLFRLTEATYGQARAWRAALLFFFCPATVFFSIPYTESLFVLLTLLCAYMARRRRFGWAIFFGALSAFTRMPGIVSAVPIFYEMLRAQTRPVPARRIARCALLCALVLVGLGAYLLVNWYITGNPFQFLVYQREHWGQRMGNLYRTAGYSIYNAFFPNVEWYRAGVWIPQCVSMLLFAPLLLFGARRAHPGDAAYALVYSVVVLSPTMLLSGPRYLCGMYPLYAFLALLPKRRAVRHLAYAAYAVLFVYCSYMYAVERIFL